MTPTPIPAEALRDALSASECNASIASDGTVVGHVFEGRRGRQAHLDPARVSALLADVPGDPRVALASFARGVTAVLSEPTNSRADEDAFVSAARSMLPTLEGPGFVLGALAAGGKRPFVQPFGSDLHTAYVIELDEGFRVVTEEQVTTWGVTADRIHKASLSILFHRTTFACFETVSEGLECFAMRDGYDGARAHIFEMWDYHRARRGIAFTLPDCGTMLLTDDTSAHGIERLTEATSRRFADARCPLSQRVFRFVDGRLAHATEAP
jgi:hypothetical protein